jgi:peptide/nickel transport system substrate-binding protein
LSWPIVETKEYKNAYVPLEKMPAEVQELYSYNPTKAKQLLTEAGYPNGFKTTVICYNTPTQIDVLSQIKAFWAKIGVDLQIDAKDYAVWTSIMSRRSYDEMLYGYESGIGTFFKMINYNGPSQFNGSYVDDAKVKEAYLKMQDYVAVDEKKMDDIHRELMPYVLSQSWVITRTQPYIYTIWTPWIKNYQGEDATGYYDYRGFAKFIWVDQEMKQKMTGR